MGPSDDRAGPRHRGGRSPESAWNSGGAVGSSLGDRSGSATRETSARHELRALFPARWLPCTPGAHPSRRVVRAHGRSPRVASAFCMSVRVFLASTATSLVLFLPARGLAADAKLRGVIVDYRLDGDQLPADVP